MGSARPSSAGTATVRTVILSPACTTQPSLSLSPSSPGSSSSSSSSSTGTKLSGSVVSRLPSLATYPARTRPRWISRTLARSSAQRCSCGLASRTAHPDTVLSPNLGPAGALSAHSELGPLSPHTRRPRGSSRNLGPASASSSLEANTSGAAAL